MVQIKDRIVFFIEKSNLPYQQIEKKLGVSNGFIGKIVKGSSFNVNLLDKFLIAFPELNPLWLISGEGAMLKIPPTFEEVYLPDKSSDIENRVKKLETLLEKQGFAV